MSVNKDFTAYDKNKMVALTVPRDVRIRVQIGFEDNARHNHVFVFRAVDQLGECEFVHGYRCNYADEGVSEAGEWLSPETADDRTYYICSANNDFADHWNTNDIGVRENDNGRPSVIHWSDSPQGWGNVVAFVKWDDKREAGDEW